MITLVITRATLIISPKRCFLTPTVFLVWGGDDTGTKKSISAKAAREGGLERVLRIAGAGGSGSGGALSV